jgi:hypothetical protein
MRRAPVLLVPVLALAAAAPAHAGVWVRAARVAGPARVLSAGNATLGDDGTGAVAFVERVGDRKHHDRDRVGAVARIRGGRWSRPAILARGSVSDIAAAAGTDGRLAVAWIAGGNVWGLVSGSGAVAAPVQLGGGHASGLAIAMGPGGVGYAAWAQDGPGGSDVRAAQVDGTAWTPLGAALDADPLGRAGTGASRPSVAVAGGGAGVVAWGERLPDGSNHVFARRLTGTDDAPAPFDAGVATLGTETGGAADSPVVDDLSAAWVAFRQDVGGRSRSLARPLGAAGFGAPVALDGGATSRNPVVAVGGDGQGGVGAAGADDGSLRIDPRDATNAFVAPTTVPGKGGGAPAPVAAWASIGGGVAYAAGGGSFGRLVGLGTGVGAPTTLSRAGAGPVRPGSLRLGADADGDALVAMVQGSKAAQRRVTVARLDQPPGAPVVVRGPVAGPRPRLRWTPGEDAFGAQRFRVRLDGAAVGTTSSTSLRVKRAVPDGRHAVQVTAIDARGQTTTGPRRRVLVDSTAPSARVTATRSGRTLVVHVQRSDSGSGVAGIDVAWGDGTSSTGTRGPFRHRYASVAARTVTVTVRDRAGNRTVRRFTA